MAVENAVHKYIYDVIPAQAGIQQVKKRFSPTALDLFIEEKSVVGKALDSRLRGNDNAGLVGSRPYVVSYIRNSRQGLTPNQLNGDDASTMTTSQAVSKYGFSWALLVGSAIFLWLLRQSFLLNDGDTLWHIATGRWILENKAIPFSDPFSHTLRGAPWVAHEWLADVLLAAAYAVSSLNSVIVLAAAAYAIAFALLTRYLMRHIVPIYALLFVALAWGLSVNHMLARPHAIVVPLLVFWSISLATARDADHTPPLWLAVVVALWANLHGSFPLALVIAGAFAAEAMFDEKGRLRQDAFKSWGLFLLASFIATLLTPHGIGGWHFVSQVHDMDFSMNTISEWRSTDFSKLSALEVWLLMAAALVLLRGFKLPLFRLLLLLGLVHLALKHGRHTGLLGMLAPIIVAQPFGAQWKNNVSAEGHAAGLDRVFEKLAQPAGRVATLITVIALAIVGVVSSRYINIQPAASAAPAAALQAARAANVTGPVFNAYEFGGYLIFSGVAPFIDARADLYGDAFIKNKYYLAVGTKASEILPGILNDHKITWTILQPQLPAVALLDQLPGWRRLYADDNAVVHVKQE